MRNKQYLLSSLFPVMLISCYHEVDLDEYRDKDGENILTINSLVCPDSSLQVSATKTYFFSDIHNDRTYVKDLNILVKVNEVGRGIMEYDKTRNLYISDIKIQSGDRVTISTEYSETFVSASDIMPDAASIEGVSVERQGPVSIYTNSDFIFTYGITFTDRPDEDNYYFLQWDAVERGKDIRMGERDFAHELVFQQLASQIHSTLPGWEPYSPYGLPFSDKGIDGKEHTIVVKEIVQMVKGSNEWRKTQMKRGFRLYAISKAYYDYLVSVLINQTGDKGLQGGMIDLGIADPVKVFSNIEGGVGILGCYTMAESEIDVMKIVGPFPTE